MNLIVFSTFSSIFVSVFYSGLDGWILWIFQLPPTVQKHAEVSWSYQTVHKCEWIPVTLNRTSGYRKCMDHMHCSAVTVLPPISQRHPQ